MLNLEPKLVFEHFEKISQIPRPSGHEKSISDYLVSFAKERGLDVIQDERYNIVIRKPATSGYENAKKIILQCHMDMVPEKTKDSNHDFLKDPIELVVDGDNLTANKTTLGADDGIGIAMALAIIDDENACHGPLEVLVTVSEETDLGGAQALSDKVLEGEYLINIDSEEEGIMTVGSAGGELYIGKFNFEYENNDISCYEVDFSGLLGGHSGMEIQNNRGNIIVIMADFLKTSGGKLVDFIAGTQDNAIPRMGVLKLACENNLDDVKDKILKKYENINGNLEISISKIDTDKAMSLDASSKFSDYLLSLPTGVDTFTDDTKKFVASSSNLAIVKNKDNYFEIWDSIRFDKESLLDNFKNKFVEISKKFDVEYEFSNYYPEWTYKEDSKLRELALETYKDLTGKDMKIDITHGGLECGVFYIKYKHLDMISVGPDISGAHTPDETLSISSTKRVYDYIVELLKRIK